MHSLFVVNKKLDKQYPRIKLLLTGVDEESRLEAARSQFELAKFVHSVNLLRWYGEIRNKGQYNKDCVFSVYRVIERKLGERAQIKAKIEKWFPSAEILEKHFAQSRKAKMKKNQIESTIPEH